MADEKKVFDVAKPGTSKPDTGSKPMVVGHKSMASDPAIAADNDTADNDKKETAVADEPKTEETSELPSQKKITIEPLPKSDKPDGVAAKTTPKSDKIVTGEENTSTASDTEKAVKPAETDTDQPEKKPAVSSKDKKKSEQEAKAEEQIAREEKLTELIKSKKYNVSIHEARGSAVKMFVITFVIVGIVGVALVAMLVDAEIIDLGIELPFDLI